MNGKPEFFKQGQVRVIKRDPKVTYYFTTDLHGSFKALQDFSTQMGTNPTMQLILGGDNTDRGHTTLTPDKQKAISEELGLTADEFDPNLATALKLVKMASSDLPDRIHMNLGDHEEMFLCYVAFHREEFGVSAADAKKIMDTFGEDNVENLATSFLKKGNQGDWIKKALPEQVKKYFDFLMKNFVFETRLAAQDGTSSDMFVHADLPEPWETTAKNAKDKKDEKFSPKQIEGMLWADDGRRGLSIPKKQHLPPQGNVWSGHSWWIQHSEGTDGTKEYYLDTATFVTGLTLFKVVAGPKTSYDAIYYEDAEGNLYKGVDALRRRLVDLNDLNPSDEIFSLTLSILEKLCGTLNLEGVSSIELQKLHTVVKIMQLKCKVDDSVNNAESNDLPLPQEIQYQKAFIDKINEGLRKYIEGLREYLKSLKSTPLPEISTLTVEAQRSISATKSEFDRIISSGDAALHFPELMALEKTYEEIVKLDSMRVQQDRTTIEATIDDMKSKLAKLAKNSLHTLEEEFKTTSKTIDQLENLKLIADSYRGDIRDIQYLHESKKRTQTSELKLQEEKILQDSASQKMQEMQKTISKIVKAKRTGEIGLKRAAEILQRFDSAATSDSQLASKQLALLQILKEYKELADELFAIPALDPEIAEKLKTDMRYMELTLQKLPLENFITALKKYIEERGKGPEYLHLFGRVFGYSRQKKIDAASALLTYLEAQKEHLLNPSKPEPTVTQLFHNDLIGPLTQGELGKIVAEHIKVITLSGPPQDSVQWLWHLPTNESKAPAPSALH